MDYRLSFKLRKTFNIIILLFGALVCIMFISQSNIVSWDFHNNLWIPSYLLVRGESPYLISEVSPNGNAVWFPMIIGILFPIGWIGAEQASMFWLIINLVAIIAIVIMSSSAKRPSLVYFFVGTLLFLLYPRTIAHLRLGQFTIVATLLFLVSTSLVSDGKLVLASLFSVLAISKPQLGILVIPGLLIAVWQSRQQRKWRYIFFMGISGIFLLIPLYLGNFMWVDGFIEALGKNPTWLQPNIYNLLPRIWGQWGALAWAISFIIMFIINIRLWQTQSPKNAIYWSLALTPLISPYIWSWDFIMGLPLFVRTLTQAKHTATLVFLFAGYVISWMLMFNIIVRTDGSDHRFWWASWVNVFLVILAYLIDGRRPKTRPIMVTSD